MDHTDKDSDKTEWKIQVFEEGDAEDWVKWHINYDNLVEEYEESNNEYKNIEPLNRDK